jgi:hypothetical protein
VVSALRAQRYDRWRDVDGTHVPVGARVEQVEVDARRGALHSRLHAQGLVTSRGTTRLVVRFEGEEETVSIRPHLVQVARVSAEEHHQAVAGSVARGPDHDHAQ